MLEFNKINLFTDIIFLIMRDFLLVKGEDYFNYENLVTIGLYIYGVIVQVFVLGVAWYYFI